jgi:hypothetical protein
MGADGLIRICSTRRSQTSSADSAARAREGVSRRRAPNEPLRPSVEHEAPRPSSRTKASSPAAYCFAQTITALAPPSQLAPVVPSICRAAPPEQ